MGEPTATRRQPQSLVARYLPDFVFGANDGIITTFAIISGVVGGNLSGLVVIILGFSNLLADGFSMAAGNDLSQRSRVEERPSRDAAARSGLATFVGFLDAGIVPLIAYLIPIPNDARYPIASVLTLATLFGVGAGRTIATKRGWLRSGLAMLVVGALAAAVAYALGAVISDIVGGQGPTGT